MAVYIGTSGWSYPKGQGTLEGTFYPPKLADKDKLTFYSQFFNTVEINSSWACSRSAILTRPQYPL